MGTLAAPARTLLFIEELLLRGWAEVSGVTHAMHHGRGRVP